MTELHLKYRPKTFKDMVGQDEAVATLMNMGKRGEIPHLLLFTGPSGCGKTTLARIIKDKLKCSDIDFNEVNAADDRGIDMVRSIRQRIGAAPLNGDCRVWLIDEAHAMTGDAQSAFLKTLEEPPSHVYFMLATTDPQKLKVTIKTRATEIKCKELKRPNLLKLINSVIKKEGKTIHEDVAEKIAEISEGSARQALVLLHSIIGFDNETEQLESLQSANSKRHTFEICRALMSDKTAWANMATILKEVDENVETIRWMILGYCKKIMLGNGNHSRAALIIEEFREPLYESEAAGLIVCCWNIIKGD